MKNIFKECDVVFLSYDEPLKDQHFQKLKSKIPQLERVDGIKGLDEAHRACAKIGSKSRVVIIDGDNSVFLYRAYVTDQLLKSRYVLSFASQNSINGLCYGNGGIKCWPRELLKEVSSHKAGTDFIYDNPYYQEPQLLSVSEIHHAPMQAFRSGLREAIKLIHVNGKAIPRKALEQESLDYYLPQKALFFLRTWLQVGRDVENGVYAILGARLALEKYFYDGLKPSLISDYDYLDELAKEPLALERENREEFLTSLMGKLAGFFKSGLCDYNSLESRLYKSAMVLPLEKGPVQAAREFF